MTTNKSKTPRIYTVPSSQPFLTGLARAILNGDLPNTGGSPPTSLELADITLYMPTRRAARALSNAFLSANNGGTMLLPTIRPISEGDEELTLLTDAVGLGTDNPASIGIAPAISETERRLTLTELVLAWSRAKDPDNPFTPAQSANLARDLASLMDLVETEAVSLDGLSELAGDSFAEHWQETLQFLEIITQAWPAHLTEKNLISTTKRRNELIHAEARRLENHPPQGPVIVAGVTGSVPATTQLMRAVLGLENGAIVLPAVDLELDDESWEAIAPSDPDKPQHPEQPQYGFCKLLRQLDVSRAQIRTLAGGEPDAMQATRLKFFSETMRPTRTTDKWHTWVHGTDKTEVANALNTMSAITAPSAQDEAEVIALILREAAETPGRTAALISPDRFLARRVAIRLETWGIRVDDSAGRPFAKTVTGTFLDLVIDCIAKDFAPAKVVALLKHPLTRLGLGAFEVRRAARALELIVFRTTYLGKGLDGIDAALKRRLADHENHAPQHRAVKRLWEEDRKAVVDLVERLTQAYEPLSKLYAASNSKELRDFVEAHLLVGDALTKLPEDEADGAETAPLYQGEAGAAAAQFFANMLDPAIRAPKVVAREYPDLYRSLIVDENVRPHIPVHPRLAIWGPFEARLQQPDVVILGSLNDGTWPGPADPGPWLNRPMRQSLGLPAPEEALGRAAHDFTCLVGAKRVYLTRSEKVEGVPTVPSRWMMRMQALLEGFDLPNILQTERPWLNWARQRDYVSGRRPTLKPPAPCPPVKDRPRYISVSGVERWLASPYSIFARNILGLEPLDAIGEDAGASLKGTIIHEALARFANKHPKSLPDNIETALLAEARDVLSDYAGDTRIAAFWIPRFERFAAWFGETETARREHVMKSIAERTGRLVIEAPFDKFTLTARADRIDLLSDSQNSSSAIITDYKTGTPPNKKRVISGQSPQLPLEAAIARAGGFDDIPADIAIEGLRYISASGKDEPGEESIVATTDSHAIAETMLAKLEALVALYDDPTTAYEAKRRRGFDYRFDDYAHLARVGEWSVDGEGDGA
ncbi:MAG: double-strand break repair protein AddB [Hyphomicrobiaceae bacterium]